MKKLYPLYIAILLAGVPVVVSAAIPPSDGTASAKSTNEGSATLQASDDDASNDVIVVTGTSVVGTSFVLDGSKSQDDGTVRSFLWRQVSGPVVSLSSKESVKASVVPKEAGTYVFELVVTDSTGRTSVVQKSEIIVGKEAPQARTTPGTGDPDFDLLKVQSSSGTSGSVEPARSTKEADTSAGKGSITGDPDFDLLRVKTDDDSDGDSEKSNSEVDDYDSDETEGASIGDPDFDLLNIGIDEDDLSSLRAEVSGADDTQKVNVRGWDPKKKEEIVGRPQDVDTSAELKVYLEAVALSDEAIKEIAIKDERVVVTSEEKGKLFGFIPVTMSGHVSVDYTIRDSTEDRVEVRLPWWHVFVKKTISADALETELSSELDDSSWQKVDNSETPTDAGRISRILARVSNVLKTRHDTVKNSVSNVR